MGVIWVGFMRLLVREVGQHSIKEWAVCVCVWWCVSAGGRYRVAQGDSHVFVSAVNTQRNVEFPG